MVHEGDAVQCDKYGEYGQILITNKIIDRKLLSI